MRTNIDSREGYDAIDEMAYNHCPTVSELYARLMSAEPDYGDWEYRTWRTIAIYDCGSCAVEVRRETWTNVQTLLENREDKLSVRDRPIVPKYGETTENVLARHSATYHGTARDDT